MTPTSFALTLLAGLFAGWVAVALKYSRIGRPVRVFVASHRWLRWADDVIACSFCLSAWSSLAALALTQPNMHGPITAWPVIWLGTAAVAAATTVPLKYALLGGVEAIDTGELEETA